MPLEKNLLSIVVPVYNEEESINETVNRLQKLRDNLAHEIDVELVFVDDGSKDGSLFYLRSVAEQNPNVKVISFSRNFGHQIAITAGIDLVEGDYVAVIDADLQDPPELIADMYRMALTGFDVVYGKRRSRAGETIFKKATAATFYRLLNYMCEIDIPPDTGDFRLMSRKVVESFKQLRERHRFVRGMVPWLGYRATPLEYDRAERFAGETKYPFRKMMAFAINAILSFSSKPLTMAIHFGLLTIFAGLAGGAYMLYLKFFTNTLVPGLTAVLLSIVLFSGVQILLIGVIGEYIARIFEEIKDRPLYLINETINL
ncbi:MAG: glycosyltransferase family 2 protein [Methylococcaceae bacterium]|nr:glycosyltransferase family 2 protein [Methylococcaceae bacterium]MDZ4157560.1 glycosyltransferase family 2 protein [Methylococcales bacterium]MDP2395081.1 glycosyltransferase family 2 protein [Methylococcaceae bacterium]MDP3019332.1 glycosyltransferase family 2 protein [Methylococcaceae bacterium]MDP3389088.1 glycosyltransferase family 2 protein [Methylococcaceae bacterium]